ncbi:cytochrome P450 [Streptomyces sp. NBC_01511]|uniref:hypothetical protein n=1 Tax=Streptomyces sp. NBC_01511 TaxID=2903889 RepID=UPI00386653B9
MSTACARLLRDTRLGTDRSLTEGGTTGRDRLRPPLVQIEERGDTLNELEVMTTCGLLLVAGHETTASLAPTPST